MNWNRLFHPKRDYERVRSARDDRMRRRMREAQQIERLYHYGGRDSWQYTPNELRRRLLEKSTPIPTPASIGGPPFKDQADRDAWEAAIHDMGGIIIWHDG